MEQPAGFVDPINPKFVCKLDKAIYGLKQSPRAWYKKLNQSLLQWGFRNSKTDTSMFIYSRSSVFMVVLVYVDDILVTGSSPTMIATLIRHLNSHFALKDLGPLHYFLGIEVIRRSDGFFLHQQKYAHELLERAGMLNCKPAATPVDTKAKLSALEGSPALDGPFYRSIVGALQYLTLTRPDLQYTVQRVCLHMHAPVTVIGTW